MTRPNNEAARRTVDVMLIAAFLAGIAVPFAGFVKCGFRTDAGTSTMENRTLAPMPEFSLERQVLAAFPRKFEEYFNDRFGLRDLLVTWHGCTKVFLLGMSTTDEVLIGKEGWLFYATGNIIPDYRGAHPYSSRELRAWQWILEERRDYLASMGIRYVLFIAPEKSTIYPEYLPDAVNRGKRPSRLDQFMSHMKAYSDVEVIDLREALLRAKTRERVYRRTGTHWNDVGAFVAYEELVKHLAGTYPVLKPLPRSAFEVREVDDGGSGGCARLLGLGNQLKDVRITFFPRYRPAAREIEPTPLLGTRTDAQNRKASLMTQDRTDLPSAVVIRDSFMTFIIPWLAEHFRRSAYVWGTFDLEVVEDEKPDVVIQEMAERRLSHRFGNPPKMIGFKLQRPR